MLQDDRNNYIASIYLKGKKAGFCFADVSTGTAHITELAADKIAPAVITELCRYHPSEVLMNPGLLDCREVTGVHQKEYDLLGGAGRRGALCAGPGGGLAGKAVRP